MVSATGVTSESNLRSKLSISGSSTISGTMTLTPYGQQFFGANLERGGQPLQPEIYETYGTGYSVRCKGNHVLRFFVKKVPGTGAVSVDPSPDTVAANYTQQEMAKVAEWLFTKLVQDGKLRP
jgi:hypothetical protein